MPRTTTDLCCYPKGTSRTCCGRRIVWPSNPTVYTKLSVGSACVPAISREFSQVNCGDCRRTKKFVQDAIAYEWMEPGERKAFLDAISIPPYKPARTSSWATPMSDTKHGEQLLSLFKSRERRD